MNTLSKSEKKRQFKQIEVAAKELVALSETELKRAPAGVQVTQEIALCRSLKGGALKRQIKYIAKLLRTEAIEELLDFLKTVKGSKLQAHILQHELEYLRDSLVNEALDAYAECRERQEPWSNDWPSETLSEARARFPDIDVVELKRCAHHYASTRNKTHYREIFRIIRGAAEKKRLPDHD